jgi:hypothetical protein
MVPAVGRAIIAEETTNHTTIHARPEHPSRGVHRWVVDLFLAAGSNDTIAHGKARVACNKKVPVPQGCLIGLPSRAGAARR